MLLHLVSAIFQMKNSVIRSTGILEVWYGSNDPRMPAGFYPVLPELEITRQQGVGKKKARNCRAVFRILELFYELRWTFNNNREAAHVQQIL